MTLPASITTNLFPDFKNSPIGPFARFVQEVQDTDDGSGAFIGNATVEKVGQSFQVSTIGELASVDLYIWKHAGSPTDNIVVQICADSSGAPGSVLATGIAIPSTSVPGSGRYIRSSFLSPYTVQVSITYWLVVSRSGSVDSSNVCAWRRHQSQPYANGTASHFTGGSWVNQSADQRFKLNIRTSGRYLPCVDKTNNKIRMFKSTDGGNTWSEQDSADAPALSSTANFKSCSAVQVDTFIDVCRVTSGNGGFTVMRFDTGTDQWSTSTANGSTSMPVNTNISGVAPMLVSFKPLQVEWDYVVACNGQTETVMGNARRRIKMKRRDGGVSYGLTPGFDLVGSPNTPDLTTLPGTAVDYDLRAAIMDGNGTWHGWWTQTDDSNLRHRQYNENETFSTANLMGSTAAVTSNSAAYSVGQPTNYYRNGEWYIAIPYVDSGVLKVSRVKAADAATAANWTNTSVITATIETTNSNPAVLVADNEQGGKLFLIYTKSDGKLYYTHDQANDNWVAEQELHPGTKTVGAISGGVMVDAIGLCYLDTAPVTDDLKFDSL